MAWKVDFAVFADDLAGGINENGRIEVFAIGCQFGVTE